MKETALIGYNPKKVDRYFTKMESELEHLEQQRKEIEMAHNAEETQLFIEIGVLQNKLSELDHMEKSLKQWIQRNRN